eukprot:3626096-Amphidinium_carterae.1
MPLAHMANCSPTKTRSLLLVRVNANANSSHLFTSCSHDVHTRGTHYAKHVCLQHAGSGNYEEDDDGFRASTTRHRIVKL